MKTTAKIRKGHPVEIANIQPTFLLNNSNVYVCPFCVSELCRVDAKRKPFECKQCEQAVRYEE